MSFEKIKTEKKVRILKRIKKKELKWERIKKKLNELRIKRITI